MNDLKLLYQLEDKAIASEGEAKIIVGEEQKQADWDQTDNTKVDFIKNKPSAYSLPIASSETLGGVKIGEGLSITEDGVLSSSGGGGTSPVILTPVQDGSVWHFNSADVSAAYQAFQTGASVLVHIPNGMIISKIDDEGSVNFEGGYVIMQYMNNLYCSFTAYSGIVDETWTRVYAASADGWYLYRP